MTRSQNGKAETPSYLLTFALENDAEKRAWDMLQQLSAQRRSKRTLMGFLLALAELQTRTGREYSADELLARFIASVATDAFPTQGNYAVISGGELNGDIPSIIVGTADHADPNQTRDELALSMGDLFGED